MRVQKKSSKKLVIIALCAALALAIGIGAFYGLSNRNSEEDKTPELTSRTTNNTRDNTDRESEENQPVREEQKDPLPAYEGDNVNQSNDITGVINYKSAVGSNLVLRTTINQALSSGSCSLTLTHQSTGASVNRTANIAPNPSSASCEGFDIPLSELSSGTWSIEIIVTGGNKTGILKDSVAI